MPQNWEIHKKCYNCTLKEGDRCYGESCEDGLCTERNWPIRCARPSPSVATRRKGGWLAANPWLFLDAAGTAAPGSTYFALYKCGAQKCREKEMQQSISDIVSDIVPSRPPRRPHAADRLPP